MTAELRARFEDERGASAVEYGLLAVAVAAVIVVIVFSLGTLTQESFDDSCESIRAKAAPSIADCSS